MDEYNYLHTYLRPVQVSGDHIQILTSDTEASKPLRLGTSSVSCVAYYRDLGEFLDALKSNDKLFTISRPTVKETELTSLVRLQLRGLPPEERKGFLFENVVDVKGRKYGMKVATSIYAPSIQIYALGLKCETDSESIRKKWARALAEPIEPRLVQDGPAQEVVRQGEALLEDGQGVEALPIPVEVPGYSGQIRTTNYFISKDPETGIRNMGTYSGHVFGKTKIQWEINRANHGYVHWNLWRKRGKPMPAAFVIGGPPVLFYVGSAKVQYGVDELAVCGGLAGEALELVKCKTVDIEVPAHADIVIEGLVSTEYVEPGNAYGEFTGFMSTEVFTRPVFEVTCITHRKDPTYVHVMSQLPPSESSLVRKVSLENVYYKFLRHDCNFRTVLDVAWDETSQGQWCVIKIKKTNNAQPWQILYGAASYDPKFGKFFLVVDDDIDPRDFDSIMWALSWRVQPARDMKTILGRMPGLDPSAFKPDANPKEKEFPGGVGSSAMLIDATLKWESPPVSLAKKEFMERALEIWKELGLPELHLKQPWYGYTLGYWPAEYEEDAERIMKGEHYRVNDRLERKRQEP